MNDTKITAAQITPEYIKQVSKNFLDSINESKKASKEYLADLERRKETLEERKREYTSALKDKTKKRDELSEIIIDLTSRGNLEEVAELSVTLENLENEIVTIERNLSLVKPSNLKGDSSLYEKAKLIFEVVSTERVKHIKTIDELIDIVKTEMERLDKIKKELWYARDESTRPADDNFKKVDRHFRDLDRIEAEQRQRDLAEQKARGSIIHYNPFASF